MGGQEVMSAVAKKEKGSNKTITDKARVQFDFSKESLDKLDEIVEKVNASTRAEVIRRALTLFTEILAAEKRGAKVMFREQDGTLVQVMPLF
jgi:metal-responsive CopG/Arc/MetJ family transcriptional regulator